MSRNFRKVIESLGDLPPTPVIAVKALRVMQDPQGSAARLTEIISRDPAVSARVLKTANSPLFFTGNQVSTLNHAIVILGESHLRHLVLEASLRGINKHFGVYERLLWENSIGSAIAARIVANHVAIIDPEEAFLAGLFSNIGRIIMNNHSRACYRQIADAEALGEAASMQLERDFFQFNHAEIGAAVLDRWNFPDELVKCILHHHDLRLPPDCREETMTLAAAVNLSGGMCRHLDVGYRRGNGGGDLSQLPGVKSLQFGEEKLNGLLKEFSESFKDERAIYLM